MSIKRGSESPAVSVIVPAYNAAAFLPEALDSAVRQTFQDLEIIVIDDGSTDSTSAIAESYGEPVRVIRTSNLGAALARNTGIDAAAGSFVAFLDADDIWEPEKLERQMNEVSDRVRFVYTDTISFGMEEMTGRRMSSACDLPSGNVLAELIEKNFVATSSVLLDVEIARRVGGFDPNFKIGEDWILWLRAAQLTEASCIPDALVLYRIRAGSLGSDVKERVRDCKRVIDEGLEMVELSEAERKKLRSRAISRSYGYGATLATAEGRWWLGCRCAFASFWLNPSSTTGRHLIRSLIGPRLAGWISHQENRGIPES